MWLVDGVCVVVAELVHNPGYPIVVLCREGIPNQPLELECSALALVVELVAERFSNIGVHF
jgi:hypothetical protein